MVRPTLPATLLGAALLMGLARPAQAQNLVGNPGFEDFTLLPTNYGQTDRATGWNNVNLVYAGPATGSPDYFHTMGSVGNFFGQIPAFSGMAQMGLSPWHNNLNNFREYVARPLDATLVPGTTYQLSFHMTNGTGNGGYTKACECMSVHFSEAPLSQNTTEPILLTPTIDVPGMIYVTNTWQQFTFTFTATAPWAHITFGNFRNDAATTVSTTGGTGVYYFLDDIELIALSTTPQVTRDTLICAGGTAQLTGFGADTYAWATADAPATIIGTDSALSVSPSVTTTYLLYADTLTLPWTVQVVPFPVVDLGPDTLLCGGAQLTLGTATPGAAVLWSTGSTAPSITVGSAGTYWVQVDNSGCVTSDTVSVSTLDPPLLDLGPDVDLCPGQTLALDATNPAATYLWQDGSTAATYTVDQPGTFSVTVNNACGTVSDAVVVQYLALPVVDLGPDLGICPGDTVLLNATQPGSSYLWNTGAQTPTLTVSTTGTYSVQVTNVCGSATDAVSIVLGTPPALALGNDTVLCTGATLLLDATQPGSGTTYLWNDGSTQTQRLVSGPGTYAVVATNGCGTDTDSLTVQYIPLPDVQLGPDTSLCPGGTLFLDVTHPMATYLWNTGSTLPTISIDGPGTYAVVLTVPCGNFSDQVLITADPLPVIDLPREMVLCRDSLLLLDVEQPGATYSWQDGSSAPQYLVRQAGSYSVTVTTVCDQAQHELRVITYDCRCEVYLPNAFTPDGDGINDRFLPVSSCALSEFELMIFNRWGEQLFTTLEPGQGWDGISGGRLAPDGVYVWKMRFKAVGDARRERVGHVTLLR